MEKSTEKKIGIWLDHARAHFIELSKTPAIIETVYSNIESQERTDGQGADGVKFGNNRSSNNEHHKHNREQGIVNGYYNTLQNKLKVYDELYLFGPTTAKDELKNRLLEDKHFTNKKIKIESADYISENQMKAMAKEFIDK